MYLALKEMRYQMRRYALVISVVVLVAYLVFFLLSLAYGLASANRTAVDAWGADGIVMSDASNLRIAISDLDRTLEDEISADALAPINVMQSVVYRNGERDDASKIAVAFMGLDSDAFAFPEVVEGEAPADDTEVVIAELLHTENGVEIGDTLEHAQTERVYTVVGLTNNYEYSVTPVVYGDVQQFSTAMMAFRGSSVDSEETEAENGTTETPDATSEATGMEDAPERVGAFLVQGEPSFDNDALRYHSIGEFTSNLPGYNAQLLTFGLMIGFLVLIAGIVIGIFMYILTVQKQTVFGIMKVQGIRNRFIASGVLWQTLVIVLIGIALGVAFTVISDIFLPVTVPFVITWPFFGGIALFMIIVALLGTFFSVRAVSAIDPLDAIE